MAVCFIVAALTYLISETVSAAAWSVPPYSYTHNYISDLGVAGCSGLFHGRMICSPLYPLMNAGFIAEGLLYGLACLLWVRALSSVISKAIAVAAGLIYGIGMLFVGIFHGSAEALLDGTLRYHFMGAVMAIATGNLFAIVSGVIGRRSGWPPAVSAACVILGIVGLSCALLLLQYPSLPVGIPERGSVYTIMLWELLVGTYLLRTRGRH